MYAKKGYRAVMSTLITPVFMVLGRFVFVNGLQFFCTVDNDYMHITVIF